MPTPAFDAVATQTGQSTDSLSWSHTCAGTDRALIVAVCYEHASVTVDEVTYAGVELTLLEDRLGNGNFRVSVWGLLNPALGTNTVEVTLSGAATAPAAHSVSFTNVSEFLATEDATGGDTTPTLSIAAQGSDLVVDALAAASSTAVVGAGQTQRSNFVHSNSGFVIRTATSTEPGQAATTMSWALNQGVNWTLVAVVLKSVIATIPNDSGARIEQPPAVAYARRVG